MATIFTHEKCRCFPRRKREKQQLIRSRASQSFWSALLLVPFFLLAAPHRALGQSPQQIVQKVVQNEIYADDHDHSRWMYKDAYKSPDKNVVKLVIETANGNLSQLIESNGHPPTSQERQADQNRMQQMLTDPSFRQKQKRNDQHDDQQARDLMNMLPKAFIWQVTGRENGEIHLSYRPNPSFSPPSMSAKVLAAMSGTLVVDEHQLRLKILNGRLTQPVEFGWGLLGHLNAGGTFQIIRTELRPGIWDITQTHVHISGHALFFKTIGDQEDEISSDYRPVPEGVDLAKAAQMLRDGQVAHELHAEVQFDH